jgi:hypothetical protein
MQPHSQTGAESDAGYTQTSHKEQFSGYNACHHHSCCIQTNSEVSKAGIFVPQHVLNALMYQEHESLNLAIIPMALLPSVVEDSPSHIKHFSLPMVHPVTGETISSNKLLMSDSATSEIWQTAFGKDIGGMVQGNHKTGQKGTSAMFAMIHNKIRHIL